MRTSNTSSEARLDIKVSDFWNRGHTTFLDTRIAHVNIASNKNHISKLYSENMKPVKNVNTRRVLDEKRGTNSYTRVRN